MSPEETVHRRPHGEPWSARSSLVPHNVYVGGNRTSVRLEPVIWDALRSIANRQEISLQHLISGIARRRTAGTLSSAIRAYVVAYLFSRVPDAQLASGLQESLN